MVTDTLPLPSEGSDAVSAEIATPVDPPKPLLRGRIHQVAFYLSIPAGITLVLISGGVSAKIATALFALSLAGLFGTSSTYHIGNWTPRVKARWRRMDHAMIFVLIAGSYTPVALLALQPAWGIALLSAAWTIAVLGVTLALVKFSALNRIGTYMYIGLGWMVVLVMPVIVQSLTVTELALLVAGGVLYTVGAIGLRLHWPDPRPSVFGYHEAWHVMTVAAAACHFTLVVMLVR